MELLILFAIMAALFWFMIVRPQRKRMLEHQGLMSRLEVGDEIMSTAGIYGTVQAIHDDDTVELEVADGVIITITKGAIAQRTEDDGAD
jgi:preprotein translocase subunit YajC